MMLRGPGYTFTRRYILEQLATHDVFSEWVLRYDIQQADRTFVQALSSLVKSRPYWATLIPGGSRVWRHRLHGGNGNRSSELLVYLVP